MKNTRFKVFAILLAWSIIPPCFAGTTQTKENVCGPGEDEECISSEGSKSWIADVHVFLQEKIFGQKEAEDGSDDFLTMTAGGTNADAAREKNQFLKLFDALAENAVWVDNEKEGKKSRLFDGLAENAGRVDDNKESPANDRIGGKKESPVNEGKESSLKEGNQLLDSLLDRIERMRSGQRPLNGIEYIKVMHEAMQKAGNQLDGVFKKLVDEMPTSSILAMVYYLAEQDAKKNPSWKRKQHRFYDEIAQKAVVELHDALYLSQLTYVDTVDDFRRGLAAFRNDTWALGHGTTDSLPSLPAYFLLIHKNIQPLEDIRTQPKLPWGRAGDSELHVALAVRGTKHFADLIADLLLETVEYRGGRAHGGIVESGVNLANEVLPQLRELLKYSRRDRIRLFLVGHSLGAAAAAIAAMELRDHNWIKVEVVGFGCPSLLSHDLSESTKDYITTVVADADIVPRMSGASISNLIIDLMEYDWTNLLLEDIDYSLERARKIKPRTAFLLPKTQTVVQWAKDLIRDNILPLFGKKQRERLPSTLIPPGTCIHFYRDGISYSGTFMPCDYFSSIEFARTLIDDHMIMEGYHRAMLTIVREWEQNFNFDFKHDIDAIPTGKWGKCQHC